MDVTCTVCNGTGTGSDNNPCRVCSGDGIIGLTDADFPKYIATRAIHGVVWDAILTKLDTLDTKIDAIAAQVQVLFDDLNQ